MWMSPNFSGKRYKNYLEVGVINFIKGYLAKVPCLGLKGTEFKRVNDLISFIYGFEYAKELKLTNTSISNLKHRIITFRPVPKTVENIAFTNYVKSKLPYFDESSFLKRKKESKKEIKKRKKVRKRKKAQNEKQSLPCQWAIGPMGHWAIGPMGQRKQKSIKSEGGW